MTCSGLSREVVPTFELSNVGIVSHYDLNTVPVYEVWTQMIYYSPGLATLEAGAVLYEFTDLGSSNSTEPWIPSQLWRMMFL